MLVANLRCDKEPEGGILTEMKAEDAFSPLTVGAIASVVFGFVCAWGI